MKFKVSRFNVSIYHIILGTAHTTSKLIVVGDNGGDFYNNFKPFACGKS